MALEATTTKPELKWDDAFGGNRLLATFPRDLRDILISEAEIVALEEGETVLSHGVGVKRTLFPIGRTMISMIAQIREGKTVEVASIGREGAVGGIVSCGHAPAFSSAEVIVAGSAVAVPMDRLESAKGQSPHLRNIFCRYADYLLAQVMQSVACNSFHPIDARAARWLLTAQDRAGSHLELTQEAFSRLLGAQRTTVNAVARQLQDENLIAMRRGAIEIIDRDALQKRSCDCYAQVENFFDDIIGKGGDGSLR